MTTTAVFAEVLAIGVESAIVIGLAVAAFADLGPIISAATGWEGVVAILLLAIAYVLGVIVDRLADSLFAPLRRRASRRGPETLSARRRAMSTSSPLADFLEYQRSRIRLMRGTMLNLILAIPVVAAFALGLGNDSSMAWLIGAEAVVLLMLGGSAFAYVEIIRAQDGWLDLEADKPIDAAPGHPH